jgi:hypothetical protein
MTNDQRAKADDPEPMTTFAVCGYNFGTMAKAVIKTTVNDASVEKFLNGVADEQKRADAIKVLELMTRVTSEKPRMWGASIVGFGEKTYKSPATGREVDWLKIGFSPRKANLTLYVLTEKIKGSGMLEKLGPHTTGVGCLYVKRLSDVDEKVLTKLVQASYKEMSKA